jgi:hypothetical protein
MQGDLASAKQSSPAGLCSTCGYARRVEGKESVFYLCERSFTDSSFLKYPRLPVLQCSGYVADEARHANS